MPRAKKLTEFRMTAKETIAETILAETRETRVQIETLLNPQSSDQDPIAIIVATLTELVMAARSQMTEIQELRAEVSYLSNMLQERDLGWGYIVTFPP